MKSKVSRWICTLQGVLENVLGDCSKGTAGGAGVCMHLEGKPETEMSINVCEQAREPACIHLLPYSPTPPNFRGLQVTITWVWVGLSQKGSSDLEVSQCIHPFTSSLIHLSIH